MSVLLALLLVSSGNHRLDGSISFSAPAGRAKTIFPLLSKAIGIQLETSPTTAGEALLIQVKNVSSQDLLTKIAKVTHAEWKSEGSVLRLVRPTTLLRTAENQDLAHRIEDVKAQLSRALTEVQSMPTWSKGEATKLSQKAKNADQDFKVTRSGGITMAIGNAVEVSGPSNRAIPLLLNDIDAAKLAQINADTRIVFGLQPTAMQRPLGHSSPRILRDFVSQMREYADIFNKTDKAPAPKPNRQGAFISIGGDTPAQGPGNPDLGIGQAILTIRRLGDTLMTELTVADTNGLTLASGSYSLRSVEKPQSKLTGLHPITLSPLAQELAKTLNPGGGAAGAGAQISVVMATVSTDAGGDSTPMEFTFGGSTSPSSTSKLSTKLLEKILHPETYDPMSFAPGEGFASAADSLGLNLVADLPDSCFAKLNERLSSGKTGAEDLVGPISRTAGLEVEDHDGWLEVAAQLPGEAIQNPVNREALGGLVRSLDFQKYLKLDDMASFSLAQNKPVSSSDIDGLYLKLVNSGQASSAGNYLDNPWTLRIYATLTPFQRSSADAKRPLSLSDLTSQQRDWLAHDIFNSWDGPMVTPGPNSRRVVASSDTQGDAGIRVERTQLLPDGLPRDGMLTFTFKNEQAVLGINSKTGESSVVTASRLASQMYQSERPELAAFTPSTKSDLYRPAYQSSYNFRYQLLKRLTFNRSLTDSFMDNQSKPVAYTGLPQDFRSQVDKRLSLLRKNLGALQMGDSGGAPPP